MARPRLHDAALRIRLMEVSSEVIATQGEAGLTVRGAAARAGTSASAVYALFGGRDELVRAVGDEAFRRFAAHLAGVSPSPDPAADLLALGLAYRRNAIAEPHFYRVMFETESAGARDPSRGPSTEEPTFLLLRDAVARVLGAGTERPHGVRSDAASELAIGFWGLVHGLVGLELAGLLPGAPAAQASRYETVLRAMAGAVLAPSRLSSGDDDDRHDQGAAFEA